MIERLISAIEDELGTRVWDYCADRREAAAAILQALSYLDWSLAREVADTLEPPINGCNVQDAWAGVIERVTRDNLTTNS